MAYVYDPIACMCYEESKAKTKDAALQEIESKGPYMLTKSDSGRWGVLKNGVPIKYGMESEMRKYYAMVLKNNGYTTDSASVIDKAISNCDGPSRGHEIIVKTENYLRSIGKNNSVGKYDRVVRGVKSLLEEGFLEGPELDRAIKQEADRLLRKYNPEG